MALVLFRLLIASAGAALLLSPLLRAALLGDGGTGTSQLFADAREVIALGGWLDLAGGGLMVLFSALPGGLLRQAGDRLRAPLARGDGAPRLLLEPAGPGERAPLRDCLFVSAVTVVTAAYYLSGLGFYADDYGMLQAFLFSDDQSLGGLFGALYGEHQERSRPVHVLYSALLYTLFGTDATGYQLVNLGVLVAGAILLHAILRALEQP